MCRKLYALADEVVSHSNVFIPNRDLQNASLLVIQMQIELLPPLRVEGLGNCLFVQKRRISNREIVFLEIVLADSILILSAETCILKCPSYDM